MHYSDRKCYEYRVSDFSPEMALNRRAKPYGSTGMTHDLTQAGLAPQPDAAHVPDPPDAAQRKIHR